MKKAIVFFALAVVVLMLFSGCQTPRDPNVLFEDTPSEDQQQKINHALVLQCDIVVNWYLYEDGAEYPSYWYPYYGTINNCAIVRENHTEIAEIPYERTFEIAGYTFNWMYRFDLFAYRDGEACKLEEAYEKGWMTKKQIGIIHEKHQELYADWQKTLEEASEKTQGS